MKMTKKILILFSILLFQNYLNAQKFDVSDSIEISKPNIYNIFQETVEQDKDFPTTLWFSDNTNDKYFKSDTIKLIHANSYKRDYCNIINWTFQKKDEMIRTFADYCEEPPTAKVTTENDYFEVRISEKKSNTFLELYNKKRLVEKFKIESLVKNQILSYEHVIQYILTLVRTN